MIIADLTERELKELVKGLEDNIVHRSKVPKDIIARVQQETVMYWIDINIIIHWRIKLNKSCATEIYFRPLIREIMHDVFARATVDPDTVMKDRLIALESYSIMLEMWPFIQLAMA